MRIIKDYKTSNFNFNSIKNNMNIKRDTNLKKMLKTKVR